MLSGFSGGGRAPGASAWSVPSMGGSVPSLGATSGEAQASSVVSEAKAKAMAMVEWRFIAG